jgi:signal peptidase I
MPSNTMAPNLIGWHQNAVCPHCGGSLVLPSDPELDRAEAQRRDQLGICRDCLRTAKVKEVGLENEVPDRFVICKVLLPRRWDLVVFRSPANPSIVYVKRLVGLPGEEVVIREGGVWIDGKKLEPPAQLRGLRYVDKFEDGAPIPWGCAERPARLGPDEYFVLGDFSARSADSRNWREGAEGHPPYAVPLSHIVGVASMIYWPPARWRIFR